MIVVTRDANEHVVAEPRAAVVRAAVGKGARMIDLFGDASVVIDRGQITGIYADEAFEDTFGRRPKGAVPVDLPDPIEAKEVPVSNATPWKREQFAELSKRFGKHMATAGHGPFLLAWIEDEETWNAVRDGFAEWPTGELKPKEPRKGQPAGYVVIEVNAKEYEKRYAKSKHWVLQRYDGGLQIAMTRVRKHGVFNSAFPGAQDPDLEHGERWATAKEFELIEGQSGRH